MAIKTIGPGIEITNQDIKDGRITRFDSGTEDLSDSAMKETQTRIISSKKIQVPSASLEIGNLNLHESAGRLGIENLLDNSFRAVAAGRFDSTGSGKCEYPNVGVESTAVKYVI